MKYEEFVVTQGWLKEMKACKDGLQAFKKYFPNGGEALEVLKRCKELGYRKFELWLVDRLPPTYPPLELNTLIDSLFYPGDVHIKGDLFYPGDVNIKDDISIRGLIYIKGSLKVDGKLTVNKNYEVYADFVNVDEIDISEDAYIHARINANSLSMSGDAIISGSTKAKVVKLDGGRIYGNVDADELYNNGGFIRGNVDADEIINDGGLISGDVNTIKIDNINGGKVGGKITYKRSDEHK